LVALLGLIVGVAVVAVANLVSGFSFALAGDYRRYYAASEFVLHGANPYNQVALLVAEQQLRHLPSAINLGADGFVLVPFALWIVTPLALLPFWISFAVLATLATGAVALAVARSAQRLGWRYWWAVPIFACLSWPVVWGRLVGQLDFLALVGFLVACWAAANRRQVLAGVALLGVWVQPEVGWIAVVALLIALWDDRAALRRTAASFAGGSALLFGLSALVPFGALQAWIASGAFFLHHEAGHEFELLGAPALLQAVMPRNTHAYAVLTTPTLVIGTVGALAALAACVWLLRLKRSLPQGSEEVIMWQTFLPLAVWLLATPYGHINNAVLLVPLVMLVIGPDGRHARDSGVSLAAVSVYVVLTELCTGTIIFVDLVPLATLALVLAGTLQLRRWRASVPGVTVAPITV
jgi:hypothetical protein